MVTYYIFPHPDASTTSDGRPVGLAFAIECLRFGIHVRVVDRATSKDPYSKAFGLHARTMEHFLGMGILPAILQEANAATRVTVRSSIARASYGWGSIQCTYVDHAHAHIAYVYVSDSDPYLHTNLTP